MYLIIVAVVVGLVALYFLNRKLFNRSVRVAERDVNKASEDVGLGKVVPMPAKPNANSSV